MNPQTENVILKSKLLPPLEWDSLVPDPVDPFIGNGTFGTVWKFQNLKNTQESFAVKKLRINEDSDKEKIKKEIKTLEMLQGSDVVFPKYFGHVKYLKK